VVLTSSDTAPGYQFGASALGRQKENGLFWDMHSRTLYHLQGGAPEWGADTDYREGAIVTFSGDLYRADTAVAASAFNPGNAPWVRIGKSGYGEWHIAGSFTWNVPRGCTLLRVTLIGGGGGGGSGSGFGSSVPADRAGAGGSGGGGATHVTFVLNVAPLAEVTVVVGAGGAPNYAGGDTSITIDGTTYTAPGATAGWTNDTPKQLFTPGRYAGGMSNRLALDPRADLYKGDIGFQDLNQVAGGGAG
jgi:hypothetical protein